MDLSALSALSEHVQATKKYWLGNVMDIPVHHFYHAKAVNGPNTESDEIFHYTNMVMDVVDNLFYDDQVA